MKLSEISSKKPVRVILSGGGTAGHIYPAVAIAEKLNEYYGKDIDVIFVGAQGKMEMEKVSKLGYPIIGLPIAGLVRKFTLKNIALPFKVMASVYISKKIIKEFNPQIVIGFGGYASAPIIKAAQNRSIATMLWEGNSYAGMANRVLSKHAQRIFVSYDQMDRFFPKSKIVRSGNPLRGNVRSVKLKNREAYDYFGFDGTRPILFVTGGSLGTRVLNEGVMKYFDQITAQDNYDVIWQTGNYYNQELMSRISGKAHKNIWISAFVDRMDYAYSIADLVVARGGASTISELALVNLAAIIIPSPNVADDHQRKNALSLVEKQAVVMIEDSIAIEQMIPNAEELLFNTEELSRMRYNIAQFAEPDAANKILDEVKKFIIL